MYEGDRLVGAEITREPEWSQNDYEIVEAQDLWERSLDENGVPLSEALDRNIRWQFGEPVMNPETGRTQLAPLVNFVTKGKQDALDALRKDNPDGNLNGMFFPASKIESHPHEQ